MFIKTAKKNSRYLDIRERSINRSFFSVVYICWYKLLLYICILIRFYFVPFWLFYGTFSQIAYYDERNFVFEQANEREFIIDRMS